MSIPDGIPVPIGGIEKELGRLWEASGDNKTRASLVNLAVYSEGNGSLTANSATVRSIAGEHAMRAILVEADPFASGSSAEAWISMHCYPRGSKGGSVCSEQISFRLSGEAARSLQSVVFSHLDSDLPLALWWQAPFRTPVEGKLWRWVDRLIFDSRSWEDPSAQFAAVSSIPPPRRGPHGPLRSELGPITARPAGARWTLRYARSACRTLLRPPPGTRPRPGIPIDRTPACRMDRRPPGLDT